MATLRRTRVLVRLRVPFLASLEARFSAGANFLRATNPSGCGFSSCCWRANQVSHRQTRRSRPAELASAAIKGANVSGQEARPREGKTATKGLAASRRTAVSALSHPPPISCRRLAES